MEKNNEKKLYFSLAFILASFELFILIVATGTHEHGIPGGDEGVLLWVSVFSTIGFIVLIVLAVVRMSTIPNTEYVEKIVEIEVTKEVQSNPTIQIINSNDRTTIQDSVYSSETKIE